MATSGSNRRGGKGTHVSDARNGNTFYVMNGKKCLSIDEETETQSNDARNGNTVYVMNRKKCLSVDEETETQSE